MQYLLWADAFLAVLLTLIVMLQSKGTGLSIVGTGDFGKFERRGPEKVLHQFTIALVVAFTLVSLLLYFMA